MKLNHLLDLFLSWGFMVNDLHREDFTIYLGRMLKRNRLIIVETKDGIEAVLTFFITNNVEKMFNKQIWEVVEDDPGGHILYIDKMVCRNYTLALRKTLRDILESKFSNLEEAHYYRAPLGPHVKIRRRRQSCQNTV